MLQSVLTAPEQNISAFAVQKHGKITVLAFNKSEKDTVLSVQMPQGRAGETAGVLRLTAPAIDATTGVKLGGTTVAADGTWKPGSKETIQCKDGVMLLKLPAYSAASASFA
jgi:hypothetical protein